MGREENSLEEHKWMLRSRRRPNFVKGTGFTRERGQGSRGTNTEALDMAMVSVHAFYSSVPYLALIASGHVVHHEPTCRPDTKVKYGGGGEWKKGTFCE